MLHTIGIGLLVEADTEEDAVKKVEEALLKIVSTEKSITHIYAITPQHYVKE